MKDTKFIDAGEVYQDRGAIHKTLDKPTQSDYYLAHKLKKAGKEVEEIAQSLNLSNDDVYNLLKG